LSHTLLFLNDRWLELIIIFFIICLILFSVGKLAPQNMPQH
jgi:hypothetical protein